ncbi:MAG TPA: hypothetical protein VJO35_05300 [Terriglobales bacterium]|nr:hypothetical protein [Terriglobales bacterium]
MIETESYITVGPSGFWSVKQEPIDQINSRIEEELRSEYSPGFTPAKDDNAGYTSWTEDEQKDTSVQTRDGVYLAPE